MKKKQILAALLAATCAVSMAVPTLAADDSAATLGTAANVEDQDIDDLKGYELEVDASVQKPTLKVTLPKSTSVLINPYRIEVDIDGDAGSLSSFDTVLSPEMSIINNSGCAIKVGVKGMLQTYTVVAGDAEALDSDEEKHTITNKLNMELSTLKVVGTVIVQEVSIDDDGGKELRQVGTYKAPVMDTTDPSKVKTKGTINITGPVASKDIKVSSAAIKDVDAEKTNTLFIYVEGKQADDDWATAFDAKAAAGVKDSKTGVMSKTGMMALTAKETTQNILYLGAGDTGNVRVTGQAATAPTKSWMSLTDSFETPFTFVVDAVANEAPAGPELKNIKFANVKPTAEAAAGDQIVPNKTAYTGLTWTVSSTATAKAKITANMKDDDGAIEAKKTSYVSSNTAVITVAEDSGEYTLNAVSNGKATITATYTAANSGKTVYTFEITVSGVGA